jgi:serine/threonine protein kinase
MVTTKRFNPAAELLGHTINGWFVKEKLNMSNSSGGNFSCGYIITNATYESAFMKALDYSRAFNNPPSRQVDVLSSMINAYRFERDLLVECSTKRVRNVIRLLDSGEYQQDASWPYAVAYLIMEKADRSARDILTLNASLDTIWALKSLHGIAVAIESLHKVNIAHQDIKPSNILFFENENTSKIGDVGRASSLSTVSDHDSLDTAGDKLYSPFEQLYGYTDSDWKKRRYNCDIFMFGNLIMTYFNGTSITTSTLQVLSANHRPQNWKDDYFAILPYLENSFNTVVGSFVSLPDQKLRNELVGMVSELCHPNPLLRGDRKGGLPTYSLTRYISKLDHLCNIYSIKLRKGAI